MLMVVIVLNVNYVTVRMAESEDSQHIAEAGGNTARSHRYEPDGMRCIESCMPAYHRSVWFLMRRLRFSARWSLMATIQMKASAAIPDTIPTGPLAAPQMNVSNEMMTEAHKAR